MMKYTELKLAKCLKSTVLTLVMIGAGVFANEVQAQTARVFEIEVPFDFVINDHTYDAGTYRIGRLNESNPDMLVIKEASGKKSLILQTMRLQSGSPAEFSKLNFRQYGELYVLDSIRASGDSYESRLPYAKIDRQGRLLAKLRVIVSISGK
jgi:hypothetical protein